MVVSMVDAGEAGEIALPVYARWVPALGVVTPGVRRLVRWCSGIDVAAVRGRVGGRRGEDEEVKSGR